MTQSNRLSFSLLAVVCQTVGDRLGKNEKTKVVAKLQNPVGPNIQKRKKDMDKGGTGVVIWGVKPFGQD
jgi:hypothetical protein